MSLVEIVIVLGSNIDKERKLPEAVTRLRDHPRIHVRNVSRTFETEPVGGPDDAPAFHNAALVADTDLDPRALRAALRHIEADLGRVRTDDKAAPRTIDLDVAYYGDLIEEFDTWRVPDSATRSQAHVVVPIADVVPAWLDPVTGRAAREFVSELGDAASRVRPVEPSAE